MSAWTFNANSDAMHAYNASRDYTGKAVHSLCYAPHTNLYFDTRGTVRVCCHNTQFPVGNILKDSLDDIWRGARIKALRRSLEEDKFAEGCEFCEFQTAEGCFDDAAMRRFERFTVEGEAPEWPRQLEFSISNVCNLECIMCDGYHSSAIRSHREKSAPLPKLYSESFIESLLPYLANAKWLKFLGGEPFLITEYYRIWDMMIEKGINVPCHVTTNGTQYNQNVERVINSMPMSFAVSMDGVTRETVESIRVNADYREVFENAWRFREVARARGTSFSLTYCLMRQNWHEFGLFCLMGDIWDCSVAVNTVRQPPELGIYTLPAPELRIVLDAMNAESHRLAPLLKRNKLIWLGQLARIQAKVLMAEKDSAPV
jgi:radical SAM protein with 4Fe4S-binding SPASM domain